MKNASKDLSNGLAAGEEVGADLPTTRQALNRLGQLIDLGAGDLDSTAVSALVFSDEKLEGLDKSVDELD